MVRRFRDLQWVLGILAVVGLFSLLRPSAIPDRLLPKGSVVGVQGVCLGDTRGQLEQRLGRPGYEAPGDGGTGLYYGLHNPKAWYEGYDLQVGLDRSGRVASVNGQFLTDSKGEVLCRAGEPEWKFRQRLGKRDWIWFPWCGNDTNRYLHYEQWKLIVAVDQKSGRSSDFRLEKTFPAEPQEDGVNLEK